MLQRCAPPPNPIAQAESCWTSSQQLTALIQEVLLDILATNPDAFPVPPGVTDGSLAAVGYPGEVFDFSVAGVAFAGATTGASAAPQANYVPSFVLPAGDWDAQWRLKVDGQTGGGPQAAACWLTLPPAGVPDMMEGQPNIPGLMTPWPGPPGGPAPALGFQPLTIISASYPVNIKAQLGAVFNMCVWSSIATGTYGFHFWARRRR